MVVNIKKFQKVVKEIQKKEGISNAKLSEIMDLDYSHIFRTFKKNGNYGLKIVNGIENFCKYFNLNPQEFIFLE